MAAGVRRLAMGVGVAVAILVVVEVVLRLVVEKEVFLFSWERGDGMVTIDDQGWFLPRPSSEHTLADGPYTWRMVNNARALREEHEIPPEKPSGTYRILALGDSWIYGISVDQGHTIPDELERILTAEMGRQVEVINAGAMGACAIDIYRRWRMLGAIFELDGVLVGHPHNEDAQPRRSAMRNAWYNERPGFPATDLRLYLLLRRSLLTSFMPGPNAFQPDESPEDPGTKEAVVDIVNLFGEARRHGLRVWFADFPNRAGASLSNRDAVVPIHRTWAEALTPIQVPMAGHAMRQRSCWGWRDEGHPSESGARAIAEVLGAMIVSGEGATTLSDSPSCDDVPGRGPGKGGE